MRLHTMLWVAALVCAATISAANAQCPDPPDYPQYPFNPGDPVVYKVDGCEIIINWCWRFIPGPDYNDFIITNIHTDCDHVPNIAFEQIRDAAIRHIIENNPWGVSGEVPLCPETDEKWRLFTGGCYSDWYYDSWNNVFRQDACGKVDCWSLISACFYFDETGMHMQVSQQNFAAGTCPAYADGPIGQSIPCNPICDE